MNPAATVSPDIFSDFDVGRKQGGKRVKTYMWHLGIFWNNHCSNKLFYILFTVLMIFDQNEVMDLLY